MTNFQLKVLALIFMTIDHIGYNFQSNTTPYLVFRSLGRLSFPIFLFLIIEGYKHTSNMKKYITSIYVFAIISVFPFYYAFGSYLNIFFTLGNVLLMLLFLEQTTNKINEFIILILFLLITLKSDWGIEAIITVFLCRNIINKSSLKVFLPISLSMIFALRLLSQINIFDIDISTLTTWIIFSTSILFSIPILLLYNGERGRKLKGLTKYFFYFYYPLHLTIITYLSNRFF